MAKKNVDQPTKSGIYDDLSGSVGKSLAHVRGHGIDPTPELELMRAIVHDVSSRHAEVQAAIETIAESNDPEVIAAAIAAIKVAMKDRAQQINPEMLSRLVERFGRMVERIHKIKSDSPLPQEPGARLDSIIERIVSEY